MTPTRINQRHAKTTSKAKSILPWKKVCLTGAVSILLFIVSVASLWSFNQKVSIKHWDVYAPTSLKEDVSQALNNMAALDFWHSRPALLHEQLLSRIPDLADIQIQRQLPDTLIIHAIPRQAIALWLNKDNHSKNANNKQAQLYLVDEHGIAYRALKHGEFSALPVLRMKQNQLIAS